MKKALACSLFLILLAAAPAWAGSHGDASKAEGARSATVAGGQTIALAASAKTSAQWAKERPSFKALVPKKR